MIEVQNLTKRFDTKIAIEGVTFSVGQGEVVGLLGPNGAGKTTTIRSLTGYLPATEGQITVDGFDVFEQPLQVRRRIGYLPENPPLYSEMTVAGYLRFVGKIKGEIRGHAILQIDTALWLVLFAEAAVRPIKRARLDGSHGWQNL